MPKLESSFQQMQAKARLGRALLANEPNYMVLFVTAVCNARCPMCFYWEEIESANAKKELRLGEFARISESLKHLYYLSIGGGEPFIRPDLPKIVELFYSHSGTRVVTVATNGAYEERVRDYVRYLRERCPELQLRIQVSIDNLGKKHDENRLLPGLFDRLVSTCDAIGELKQEEGAPLMLSIGTVLTPMNRNDLTELRRFLDERVPYDQLTLLYPRGNAKDPAFKQVSLEEYRRAREQFDSRRSPPGSFSALYSAIDGIAKQGIDGYLEEGPAGYPWTCTAGKKMITLSEQGILSPCEMLYQLKPEIDSNLGNVREHDYNIPAMLRLEKALGLRRHIVDTHCSCSYECAALCNVVYDIKKWPRVLNQTFRLSRDRR